MKNLSTLKKNQIQHQALYFRNEAELSETEPLQDIVQLIEDEGYEYIEEPLSNNQCSGFIQPTGTHTRFKIGYNSNHNFGLPYKRFTLCHELGHANIHYKKLTGGPHHSLSEFQSEDEIEIEADYFSICLLAPKKAFIHQIKNKEYTLEDIQTVANYFGISIYAASLRFVELTDLCCSLMVSDTSGNIRFEKRSRTMHEQLNANYLYREPIPQDTLTFQSINQPLSKTSTMAPLNDWYPSMSLDINASESVFIYKPTSTVLTFINPTTDEFGEELDKKDNVFLRRS